ncbi:MAG TPA: Gfo/Idh/MocA family oxidoreductase [Bryobacteraceae bacterium]|nr:Gfo/Idh/MocA family oxidoreductase [Bryobacteraceae bacterium]
MNNNLNDISRRSFLQRSSGASAAAATAFTIIRPELVRGQGKARLKAGLVGCGGRGTQAIQNLLEGTENVDVVAMGDLFEDKLTMSVRFLTEKWPQAAKYKDRLKVDGEHQFTGFDAFRKVIGSDVDIVMLATPPGYRPEHFEAAINAKKHVFCEKPFGTDATGVRRFMAAAKKSEELKLTVVSGAQRRAQREYFETVDKIRNGDIGDVVATYAWWVGRPVIQQRKGRNPKWGDMEWQHRNWYSYVWICGDQIVEQHLHNIDVCNWVMGAHPVKVTAHGGVAWRPRDEIMGNIYDHIAADFTYANGVKMSSYCRQYREPAAQNISEWVVGTKGRSNCRDMGTKDINPYVYEHTKLAASIRGDGPYINEAMAVAESTMTCIMGREAAYSGLEITWDMIMNSKQDLQPKLFAYDKQMDVPPLPVPGEYKFI